MEPSLENARAELRELYRQHDETMREQWNRSLSFDDGLFDRWERARRLGWGDGANVYNSAFILEPVSVAEGTWVGPWVLLDGSGGGIRIGQGCNISAGAHIYTHDTVLACVSGGALPRTEGPVVIGDFTYIGPQATVVAGVTIGHQCVVGANSVVNRDVPDRTVVAGSPARPIGTVEGTGAATHIVRHS